jgi:hypothetical protein
VLPKPIRSLDAGPKREGEQNRESEKGVVRLFFFFFLFVASQCSLSPRQVRGMFSFHLSAFTVQNNWTPTVLDSFFVYFKLPQLLQQGV